MSSQLSGDFGSSFYSRTVSDGTNIFSFVPGWLSDNLYRLDYGTSIFNMPAYNDLGDLGGSIDDMVGLDILMEGTNWYGIATGYGSNKLYRLSFGNSLSNTPIVEDISGTFNLNVPMDIEIVIEAGTIYAFVISNASGQYPLLRLDFGSSILNTPSETEITVTGSSQLSSISLGRECEQWYGFVASRGNGKIFRMDFGDSPSNTPTIDDVGVLSGLSFDNPGGLDVVSEGTENYVFVTSRNGCVYI